MGRADRDDTTATITAHGKSAAGTYGRIGAASSTTISSAYSCMLFPLGAFARQQAIAAYGLTQNADVIRISGPYSASIIAGQYLAVGSVTYRLLGATVVKGRAGRAERMAMVAVREGA